MSVDLEERPQQLRETPMTKWAVVFWVIGGLALLTVLLWAAMVIPRWQVEGVTFTIEGIRRFEVEDQARRTLWQIILGIGGVIALIVAWLRVRAMDKTARAAEVTARAANATAKAALEQVKLVERGQITERFTRAIDQLGAVDKDGNPALEIRLGGIYALERIARDSADHHWTVMEVLTDYVRNNSPWREPEETGVVPGADATNVERLNSRKPDIQAILTVLVRRERSKEREGSQRLDLSGTDLRRASMGAAHLDGAMFSDAHLEGAFFRAAHLNGANFSSAHLKGANFSDARIKGANFSSANLNSANFSSARMKGANFFDAHLEKAQFYSAHLEGAFFSGAHLEGAELGRADLRQVTGLSPKQLMSASGWQHAYRDDKLACGEEIPKQPDEEEEKSKQNGNEV